MFEKVKDWMLEKQVRDLLERYYWRFGLTLAEAKRLPMKDLLEKLNTFLAENKNEVSYYASVVGHLDEKITRLTINNEEMKHHMNSLKGENKGLHAELAKVREDNYRLKLENTLYKQQGFIIDKEKEKELNKNTTQTKVNDLSMAR